MKSKKQKNKPLKPATPLRGAKFWPALGFAALSGSRANSGPAFISQYLSHQAWAPGLAKSPLRFLAKPAVATGLQLMLAGEFVGDKMPSAGNRIIPQQLSARTLSGALVGAAWYKAQGGSAVKGAVVGSLGAIASTFITFYLRTGISKATGVASALVGAAEDALVLASGTALVKSQQKPH